MRFFNKNRFKSIGDSKLGKYFIYATGEIILVVLGILIALWINNWNQKNDSIENQEQVATRLLVQMKKDQGKIKTFLDTLNAKEVIFDLVLTDRELSSEEKFQRFATEPFLVTVQFPILNLEKKALQILGDNQPVDNGLLKTLESIGSDYEYMTRLLEISENQIIEQLMKNLDHLKNTEDWYYRLATGRSIKIDDYPYFRSWDYRNRVAHMDLIAMQGYYLDLVEFESKLSRSIKELDEKLNK